MECYYHPEREGTDICAICGKSVCKECGLEIAGKIYCKECLEKIVGLGIEDNPQKEEIIEETPILTEPAKIDAQTAEDTIYQPQDEDIDFEVPYAQQEVPPQESKGISDDSPYNIRDNIEYSGGLESSYLDDVETYQKPQEDPQIAQNEMDVLQKQVLTPKADNDDFIYPDHDYEPQPTSARLELEDKYEKYLDDLYFDETDVPLGEQLAKDEAQYGSLTRREYSPRPEEAVEQEPPVQKKAPKKEALKEEVLQKEVPKTETPEEMEARIRAEIMKEQGLMTDKEDEDKSIHNLNYDEKEPMGILDILLSIILIIVILIVLYYLVYIFLLSSTYPTFVDALFALKNPQNVINAILTH
ncbi:MAG: hypothetical protein IKH29_07140 [Methanobrevibacter sp.]|uniref:hypothetical protein n=1 Tax=Methanobrevibacter sp. TaxID=66852 RepID=UPI0025CF092B|nr:hypothetical protein [Methanobrevibacter sp.]MBR3113470.1 hypothetical protein [Methanobrevibacter sp.]MBR6994052.1 hypothetical protein [Methanobrevibacter sp.]